MTKKILLSAIVLAVSSMSALADEKKYDASILSMEGNVLVNQGESYRTATPGMNLKEFDRVMIMDGAKLSMQYPDGCTFTFKDSQIIQVGAASACAMTTTGFVSATSEQYVEAAPGAANDDEDDKVGGFAATSGSTTGLVAAAGLAGYGLWLALKDDNLNTPKYVPAPPPPVIIPPQRPISR